MANYINKSLLLFIPMMLMKLSVVVAQHPEETIKVNGISVAQSELEREIQRSRASVIGGIVKKHNIIDMTGFWERTYEGQKPTDILRQKALDTLVYFKVQEQLLNERNLWRYKNYAELLKDLETINKARTKAKQEGTVIYGPVNYTEQSFFDYQFSNAVIRLKEELVKEKVLQADEDKLKMQFEKMQKTVYKKDEKMESFRKQIHAAYVEEAYADFISNLARQAKLEQNK